mmetsp:Transcript_30892/g.80685  ORF Transcript_30892/g.80685 Transcript_30892/m.80685 type:complete len:294 (-) Transcript_30892:6-887(-)
MRDSAVQGPRAAGCSVPCMPARAAVRHSPTGARVHWPELASLLGALVFWPRGDHHDHRPAHHLGVAVEHAKLLEIAGHPDHDLAPHVSVRHLAALEQHRELDLVTGREELGRLLFAHGIVVRANLVGHLELLELRLAARCGLLLILALLLLRETVFVVRDDLAHDWLSLRGNEHEVELAVSSGLERLRLAHDTEQLILSTTRVDQHAHLREVDLIVDGRCVLRWRRLPVAAAAPAATLHARRLGANRPSRMPHAAARLHVQRPAHVEQQQQQQRRQHSPLHGWHRRRRRLSAR